MSSRPALPRSLRLCAPLAQQLTHVVGEAYRNLAPFGVKPDTEVDLKTLDSITDKDTILKDLQASFDYQNKVIGTMTGARMY